jgi:hypothetical protein
MDFSRMKRFPVTPRRIVGRSTMMIWAVLLVLAVGRLYAQGGAGGTILGTVTDITGATIADAKVQVTSQDTGVTQEAVTTSAGGYSVPYLHPGVYKVTVSAPGFQAWVTDQIKLVVDQHARLDAALKTGQVTERIEVTAATVSLDTDTAEISQIVNSRQVVDLPLNNRNFVGLLFLSSGTVMTGGEAGNNTLSAARGSGAISINGGRSASNQYLIDGMYNNDTDKQTPAISPSIDAIQEFKLQSGAYSAEFGGSANQVNISFRSGSNRFHGTGFEFFRTDAYDANTFGVPAPNPFLRQHQFGFTLGGPVVIPKIYNGRNKSFFFANYEGLRIHQNFAKNYFVPTQAELGIGTPNGDAIIPQSAVDGFVCPAATPNCTPPSPVPLVNPNAGNAPFATDGNGNYIIPASAFSNFGTQVRTHVPVAGAPFQVNGITYNYAAALAIPITGNQQNYRFDQNLGSKNALFFRYSTAEYIVTGAGDPGLLPEGQTNDVAQETSYAGGYTRTFSSNLINQFRFGYLKTDNSHRGVAAPQDQVAALKLSGLYPVKSTPYVEVNWLNNGNNYALFGGSANNDPNLFSQPTYDMSDSLTINHGRHTITTGVGFRTLKLNDGGGASVGYVLIDGQFSNSHIGDMLLGNFADAQNNSPTPFSTPGDLGVFVHVKHWFLSPFVQDDWKVSQRLTLNLGLRYDFNSVPYNTNNHYSWFDPTGPGFLVVADKTLITQDLGSGIYKYAGGSTPTGAQKNNFAPRLGFAFRPSDQWVLRGGYGIFFDASEDSETHQFAGFYPYNVRSDISHNKNTGAGQVDNELWPAITTTRPVLASDLGFLFTQAIRKQNPYVQQYNLSVERGLGNATKVEVGYSGSQGRHQIGRGNVNQPFPYDPANPTSVASRTPFTNFPAGGILLVDRWNNNSNYNALNAKLETNTHGLNLLAAYTWSKSMDTKSAAAAIDGDSAGWQGGQDVHNPAAEYARSGYDVGQRLVLSFVDDIPIGKGKTLDLHNRILNGVFGGFQLNGIATFQGGFPFSVNGNDGSGLNGANFAERANVNGDPQLSGSARNAQHWFNTSAFTNPAPGVYGNSGRNILREPGLNSWDMSVFKNIGISEGFITQLRLETFNTFNHTNLGKADSQVTSGNFGTINSARIPGRIVQLGAKIIF